jgi:hypothetical protein
VVFMNIDLKRIGFGTNTRAVYREMENEKARGISTPEKEIIPTGNVYGSVTGENLTVQDIRNFTLPFNYGSLVAQFDSDGHRHSVTHYFMTKRIDNDPNFFMKQYKTGVILRTSGGILKGKKNSTKLPVFFMKVREIVTSIVDGNFHSHRGISNDDFFEKIFLDYEISNSGMLSILETYASVFNGVTVPIFYLEHIKSDDFFRYPDFFREKLKFEETGYGFTLPDFMNMM